MEVMMIYDDLWEYMGLFLNDFRKLIGIYGDFGRWMFMAGNQEA